MYEQDNNNGKASVSSPTLDDKLLQCIAIVKAGSDGRRAIDSRIYDLAFREIESRCSALLSNCAKKFEFLDGIDYEDLLQIARLGLLEALRDYNPDNPYFFCFVQLVVRRSITSALKKDLRLRQQLEITFHEEVPSVVDTVSYGRYLERFLTEKMVRDALEEADCSALEREVIEYHFEDMSLSEIAENMGRTYKSVEMARQRAIDKLEIVLRSQSWR
jgi:RNA polymerase sigma factor (sigma-70 family)